MSTDLTAFILGKKNHTTISKTTTEIQLQQQLQQPQQQQLHQNKN